MLAPSLVETIRGLLAEEKLSHRKIARRTGVSRGTIAAIASGKRPDYERLRAARRDDPLEPSGPPRRCPGCGGMVYLPCRLCHARSLAARSPKRPPPLYQAAGGPVGLQLKEEHRLRYEEVLAARRRAELEAGREELDLPEKEPDETGRTDQPLAAENASLPHADTLAPDAAAPIPNNCFAFHFPASPLSV